MSPGPVTKVIIDLEDGYPRFNLEDSKRRIESLDIRFCPGLLDVEVF